MAQATAANIRALAEGWIGDLEAALSRRDAAALSELFLAKSYWRDLVAFTWDTRQFRGARIAQLEGLVPILVRAPDGSIRTLEQNEIPVRAAS